MKNWILLVSLAATVGCAQTTPHTNAHAHNDYEHARPLFDALANGFTSIEADVHRLGDQLLVSHDHPGPGAKSLESLYLRPLDSIRRLNDGFIYRGQASPVLLLIDIKTPGEATFEALSSLLQKYAACLSTPTRTGAVQIVISGNRPIALIRRDPLHLASIDGRPGDLGMGFQSSEMPLISENYTKIMTWNGDGLPDEAELKTLKNMAAAVHRENKKLRLWGIPDHAHSWDVLLAAGVDIINTDQLEALNQYLTKLKK